MLIHHRYMNFEVLRYFQCLLPVKLFWCDYLNLQPKHCSEAMGWDTCACAGWNCSHFKILFPFTQKFKQFPIRWIHYSFDLPFFKIIFSLNNLDNEWYCASTGWDSLLRFVENSILHGSKEVALAAINCLQSTVVSHSPKVVICFSVLLLLEAMANCLVISSK